MSQKQKTRDGFRDESMDETANTSKLSNDSENVNSFMTLGLSVVGVEAAGATIDGETVRHSEMEGGEDENGPLKLEVKKKKTVFDLVEQEAREHDDARKVAFWVKN